MVLKRDVEIRRKLFLRAGVIFAVAWTLRFIYVLHLRGSPLADFPILDELYHVEWARALAAGDWLGSTVFFRAPLYPYLLGAVFSVLGESLQAARLVQATCTALTPVAVYFLGRRVFGEREALLGSAVAALYLFEDLLWMVEDAVHGAFKGVPDAFYVFCDELAKLGPAMDGLD